MNKQPTFGIYGLGAAFFNGCNFWLGIENNVIWPIILSLGLFALHVHMVGKKQGCWK